MTGDGTSALVRATSQRKRTLHRLRPALHRTDMVSGTALSSSTVLLDVTPEPLDTPDFRSFRPLRTRAANPLPDGPGARRWGDLDECFTVAQIRRSLQVLAGPGPLVRGHDETYWALAYFSAPRSSTETTGSSPTTQAS
jgi:hypothetical protein